MSKRRDRPYQAGRSSEGDLLPVLARNRHAAGVALCPLLGQKLKSRFGGIRADFDPQQTSTVGGKSPRRRNFLRDLKVVVLKQASKRQRLRLVRAGARSRWP